MRERFPETTCVSISDFGMDGPRAGWQADSLIHEALSGITYVSGAPDREPIALGVDVADYFAGLMGWIASLVALAQARRAHPLRRAAGAGAGAGDSD